MRPTAVVAILASIAAAVAGLVGPWWSAALLACGALLYLGRGFALFAVLTLVINGILLGFVKTGTPLISGTPISYEGLIDGAVGGLRIVALVGANLAIFKLLPAGRFLDDLRLPIGATARIASVVLAAHDVGVAAHRISRAQGLAPATPRWKRAARALPHLWTQGLRSARLRYEALRLAGHDLPPGFIAFVAVTALAVAGRMVLVAIPNVAFTYVVVFLGGLVWGPRLGAAAGAGSMILTNLMISGLAPIPFANVPAMALIGAVGGLFRSFDFTGRTGSALAARIAAGIVGAAAMMFFSVTSDIATWAMVPELRANPGSLRVLILLGLSFNVIPAAANAVIFFTAVGPIQRIARLLA